MITIELELPSASLIAAGVGLFTASEATVALVLCVHQYANYTALQIPAGLLGGFAIITIGLCFVFAAYPAGRALFTVVAGIALADFALGVYWLSERMKYIPVHIPGNAQIGLESALVALWAFHLVTMAAMETFVLCDRYYTAPPSCDECAPKLPIDEAEAKSSPNPSTESWPETLVVPQTPVAPPSPPKSPKKFSLKRMSPLRMSPLRKAGQGTSQDHHHQQPAAATGSAGAATAITCATAVSPVPVFQLQHQLPYHRNTHANPSANHEAYQRPSVSGFAIPTGSDASPVIDLGAPWVPENFRWTFAGSQFRSVSGSSQQSKATSIFAATDYNKKLNDAGFQKDEPVPVPRLQNKHSFSEYDIERMHNVATLP